MESVILKDFPEDDVGLSSVRSAELRNSLGVPSSIASQADLETTTERVSAVERRFQGSFYTMSWEAEHV